MVLGLIATIVDVTRHVRHRFVISLNSFPPGRQHQTNQFFGPILVDVLRCQVPINKRHFIKPT